MTTRAVVGRRDERPLPDLLAHVVVRLPSVLAAYGPGAVLVPAARERVFAQSARSAGAPLAAWVHESWADFVGSAAPDLTDELVDRVAPYPAAGAVLPDGLLDDVLPPQAHAVVEAAVALGSIAGRVERAGLRLVDALLRRPSLRWSDVRDRTADLALVACAAPLAAPVVGVAAVLSAVVRLAPDLPEVEVVDQVDPDTGEVLEAGLLCHVLASAAPTYLSHAVVRMVALGLPGMVGVGVQAEGQAATLWFGRGRVVVADGIADDVVAVLDGGIDPLLRTASGTLVRDLRAVPLRRT